MSAPRFSAEELVQATGGRWLGGAGASAPPAGVVGVFTDTRKPVAGACFVALRGERFDAHDFLQEAARAGAACAVVAEARAADVAAAGLPLLAVPDTLAALGALARHHRRRFRVPLVAVTGSNGKTTTREMVAAILATRGKVLKSEGNLNNEVGVPLTLLGLGPEHEAAVVEMGMNHPGEIARLCAIAEPQVGVVTNAAPAHLEGLGSVEAVADAKAELYRGLPPGGIAVANADDARMLRRAQESGRHLITFARGRGRRGDVVLLEVLSHGEEGIAFLLGIGNREVEVRLSLVGEHNATNAAAAAAAAVALGCTDREIARGLSAVRPVGRRLRLEPLPSGVFLVDDCYNANPLSMGAALSTLAALSASRGGRPAAVLGDMLELGAAEAEAHRELGAAAARTGLSWLAAFGPRSRATFEAARAGGLADGAAFHTEDVAALTAFVKERLRPGDVLLVKGSRGMRLERLVEALR
ncbi:MAG TPA: UDP-N-acetylmuramoyl-tripeptide--D-alanyl-D-alanine ligase [Anaeromyxobacteraceae bacterium]|nr:UDP-N-acetylmuramoyl-tripeptide--D-alanyl-D-alanine ligase [Anaeromyxobacteraceae bacterium]